MSTRRIAGVVIDESGAPLADVRVSLVAPGARTGERDVPTVMTDAQGAFLFFAQASDDYVVGARVANRAALAKQIDLQQTTPDPGQLRLVMCASEAVLHGTIRDEVGAPLAGVEVALGGGTLTADIGVRSGPDGAYELRLPRGRQHLELGASGYATVHDDMDISGRTRRDYVLSRGTAVTGRVIRAVDKEPVANAEVMVLAEESMAHELARTPHDGTFSLRVTYPYVVIVTASGLVMPDGEPAITVDHHVVIEMEPAAAITGRVTERGTSTPRRTWLRLTETSPPRRQSSTVTNIDGTFRFDHLRPGRYDLALDADEDQEARVVTVGTVDVSDVTLELPPRGSLSGVVQHRGVPVEGATVRTLGALGCHVESDATGHFLLEGLPAGDIELRAEAPSVGACTETLVVTMEDEEHATGAIIDLDLDASIAGRVVDIDGAPVAGVLVTFTHREGHEEQVTTADDGSFIAYVMHGGAYSYVVEERGTERVLRPASGKRQFRQVKVENSATQISDFMIAVRTARMKT